MRNNEVPVTEKVFQASSTGFVHEQSKRTQAMESMEQPVLDWGNALAHLTSTADRRD